MDKALFRKIMLNKRNSLENRVKYDEIIFNKLISFIDKYENIASYYSFNSEVDTLKINSWILSHNKNLYLPKVTNGVINFYKIDNLNDVSLGCFNVLEPNSNIIVSSDEIDCMIIPLLAYNKDFYRMGYGKGYYDKYLKDYDGFKLGIAYNIQYANDLIVESHDEKLDFVITN